MSQYDGPDVCDTCEGYGERCAWGSAYGAGCAPVSRFAPPVAALVMCLRSHRCHGRGRPRLGGVPVPDLRALVALRGIRRAGIFFAELVWPD